MKHKFNFTKTIIQALILFAFAFIGSDAFANDTPPPPPPAPSEQPSPADPANLPPAEKPAGRARTKRKEEEADSPEVLPPDAWIHITRGTDALELTGLGVLVRSHGALTYVPNSKITGDDIAGRKVVHVHA